tara:strand:+ start:52 stop:675 length:624 start_codon:yes stop_codon:yes gene_type:complete
MAVGMHQYNSPWNFGQTVSRAIQQERDRQHQANLAEKNREMQERIAKGNQALRQQAIDIEGQKMNMLEDQFFTRERQEELLSDVTKSDYENYKMKSAYNQAIQDHMAKSQADYDKSIDWKRPFRGKMGGLPGFEKRDDDYWRRQAERSISEPEYIDPSTFIKEGDRLTPDMSEYMRSKTPFDQMSIQEMMQVIDTSPGLLELIKEKY